MYNKAKRVVIFRAALIPLLLIFFLAGLKADIFAGTTGKISGRITDAETGEALLGANVVIEGTYLGAAADNDGYFYINNIPPGEYRLIVSAVGYQRVIVEKVFIKIDLTTKVDIKLSSTVISMGEDVVITATRPLVQKDLTSTSTTITSGDIKMMPVEDIGRVINLQAGVVGDHFRGGRSNEVAYLVDGVSVTDAFNGGLSVEIENSSIRQMEVITGNFNAEYGQAMSGVINIVTQDGSNKLEGTVSAYTGNYFTTHDDIFRNLDKIDRLPSRNVQLSLSGPTGISNLTFFATGRYYENKGYLFGKRVYNITDDVPFVPNSAEPDFWIPRNTGDGEYVSMNPERKYSFNGKVTYSLPAIKISYSLFYDDNFNKYYDHYFSWTPDGIRSHYRYNAINSVQLSHFPSQSTYQTFKFSSNLHQYEGYLYEDPYDPRYIDPNQGRATTQYTFRSGGNDGERYERSTLTYIAQWSLSSQISKEHKIGAGIEGRLHDIYNHNYNLINLTEGQLDSLDNPIVTLGYRNVGEEGNEAYYKKPFEIAAYVQDKMEYDIMIINAGLRLDYFEPNSNKPVNLKNVTNNPLYPGANQFEKADPKFQISPRLGASFPITDQGIIRFSYGHFFKIPNFENLYRNSDFLINPTSSVSSIMGNPDLKAEKTVQYEIGLQQVLFPNLVLNFAVYYRDIRNLLGMEIINTYEGFKYARFVNRDYGNVRGFTVTLDRRFADYFGAKIDYTFQIAEGNASDPFAVYNNNQTDPPVEDVKAVVPLNWDQRSTLNLSFNVGEPGDWSAGFIFQYGSGWPYTEDPKRSNGVRFENGGIKPTSINLDLRVEKVFKVGPVELNTFLLIYNVLDIKNENDVYASTGRANADLNVKEAGTIFGINTIDEYINNPGMYSTPREIRLGFGFGF